MNFLSKILSLITPKVVETGGFLLAILGAILLPFYSRIFVMIAEGVYLLDRFRPGLFNEIKSFANPSTWPGYVSLGVASVIAAHHGGLQGFLVVAGALAVGVGRIFNQLY